MAKTSEASYGRPLRLLIIEDSKPDAELIVAALKRAGYALSFEVVDKPEDMRQRLLRQEFDVVLSDHNLPSWSGTEALKIVLESGRSVPFVVVTGSLGDEAAVQYIKSGAADYVLKNHLERLPSVVGQVLKERAHQEEEFRLHDQIRAGKREWELTFDSVPDPIFLLDENCAVRRANRAAAEALQLNFAELIGRPCFEVVRGAGKVSVGCSHGHEFDAASESEEEKNGKTKKNFDARCTELHGADGQVAGFVFSMHDVTKRKRAEDEIRKLSRAVEQSPASVAITDPDGRIEYVNPTFTRITGYTLEEVRGKNPRILKSGETPDEEYKRLWQTITSGREWRGEFHNRKKDGSMFWASASVSPIRTESGNTVYYLGIQEDITAQKLLEEQLRQAQKMEAVGRLAGGVAHDFNNLLTIINGHAQLLIESAQEAGGGNPHLDEILKAGERAAALTRQLLAFSRKQVVALRALDLNHVIEDIQKMLRRLIGEDVELTINSGKSLGLVMADAGQIEQVLMNLVVNARDAMPHGGRLMVETMNTTLDEDYAGSHFDVRSGDYVMLAVSDTGVGMDSEVLRRVFEPFFTTKEPGRGTGLGLATVYGIVKQCGGHINVYSEPGQGTTFRAYFPRIGAPDKSDNVKQEQAGALAGWETILVVEDEAGVRSLIRAALESKGYKVLVASNPDEAEAMAGKHQGALHLLLTDVIMPGRNGKVLADALQRTRTDLRVLYMSGYTADAIGHHGVLDSNVEFLPKPFTSRELLKKVREVLGKKK